MNEFALRLQKEWLAEMQTSPGIPLWPAGETPRFNASYGQPEPSIVPYFLNAGGPPRGAVIVCPGGAYEFKAPHEGKPIALCLNDAGINAFVLDYRVLPYTIGCALLDVQRAIRTVRHRSAEWNINPDKIGILGFSAGGHLTIMASTRFDAGDPGSADPVEQVSCRPDAQVPCYPLVSFRQLARYKDAQKSMQNLFGPDYSANEIQSACGELNVRPDTPPAFLWGVGDDDLQPQWPPYLSALKKQKIPFAYHLFPHGGHGLGLGLGNALVSQWPGLCAAWLKDLGF